MAQNLFRTSLSREIGVITFGSSSSYLANNERPLEEAQFTRSDLSGQLTGYSKDKRKQVLLARRLDMCPGTPIVKSIMLSNLIALVSEVTGLNSKHLIPEAVRRVEDAIELKSLMVVVPSSPNVSREFTSARDIAKWLIGSLKDREKWPPVLNLGSGNVLYVKNVYESASKVLGFEGHFMYSPLKSKGPRARVLDSSIASDNFEWQPNDNVENIMQDYLLAVGRTHGNRA